MQKKNRGIKDMLDHIVFKYFKEISAIPRGSGNTRGMKEYLVDFARNAGLEYHTGDDDNVIIIREASKGRENDEAIILQGHTDMVCAKTIESEHDFLKDGLTLEVDGDWLSAKDTTLGGDDGIAVAYMLALLSEENISLPRIECIFTYDEETGMFGANDLDISPCRGKYLINLDSEDENVIFIGCAGGTRLEASLPVEEEKLKGNLISMEISGLAGGHSGADIHHNRGNAILAAGELLRLISDRGIEYGLLSIDGGSADNVIPLDARIKLITDATAETVQEIANSFIKTFVEKHKGSDEGIEIKVTMEEGQPLERTVMTKASRDKLLLLIKNAVNGVLEMNVDIAGLVETSSNLGLIKINQNLINMTFLVRSSSNTNKDAVVSVLSTLVNIAGGSSKVTQSYSGWLTDCNSFLVQRCASLWEKLYNTKPLITTIHAGLECGIIAGKAPYLDMVSIGPRMQDIHTSRERLSISSTIRVYDFLLELLK